MACKVIVGNFLDDIAGVPFDFDASNLSLDPDMPAAFAHDGPGKMAAQFLEDIGPDALDIFLSVVRAPAANWTVIAGSVADSADQDHGADASSLKLLGNGAHVEQEIQVRSGYPYWIEAWGFGSGSGPTAKVSLYNPDTEHWWNGSAWVDSIAYLATSATAAWSGIASGAGVRIDVEAADVTLGTMTRLVIQLWRITNATADPVYFDDILFYAGVDFIGFFGGNNVPPSMTVTWKSEDSASVQTLRGTFVQAKNQFFIALSVPVFAPFHYVGFPDGTTGLGGSMIYFGDLVVGKLLALAKSPMEPVQIDYEWKGQARLEAPGGARYIANRGPFPPRRVTLNFRYANAAQEAEALALWVDQVLGGEKAVVVMPSTEKFPNLAIYGDISGQAALSVALQGATQTTTATGELAGTSGETQDHYSDLTVVIDEGAIFQLDD